MKQLIITSLILTMVVGLGTAFAAPEGTPDCDRLYTLNIIGMQNPKNVNMDQGAGKVIFVNLNEPSKINLVKNTDVGLEADEFAVLDKDATDSKKTTEEDPFPGAILALPDPGLLPYNITTGEGQTDTLSAYSIYIRSLGKPGGWTTITTCAELMDSTFKGLLSGKFVSVVNRDGIFGGKASIEQVTKEMTLRPKGKSIFTEVTAELLTIVFQVQVEVQATTDQDGDGDVDTDDTIIIIEYVRVPIFSDILDGEYWEYDNQGLKLLQVWFYACGVDVSENDLPAWK